MLDELLPCVGQKIVEFGGAVLLALLLKLGESVNSKQSKLWNFKNLKSLFAHFAQPGHILRVRPVDRQHSQVDLLGGALPRVRELNGEGSC